MERGWLLVCKGLTNAAFAKVAASELGCEQRPMGSQN